MVVSESVVVRPGREVTVESVVSDVVVALPTGNVIVLFWPSVVITEVVTLPVSVVVMVAFPAVVVVTPSSEVVVVVLPSPEVVVVVLSSAEVVVVVSVPVVVVIPPTFEVILVGTQMLIPSKSTDTIPSQEVVVPDPSVVVVVVDPVSGAEVIVDPASLVVVVLTDVVVVGPPVGTQIEIPNKSTETIPSQEAEELDVSVVVVIVDVEPPSGEDVVEPESGADVTVETVSVVVIVGLVVGVVVGIAQMVIPSKLTERTPSQSVADELLELVSEDTVVVSLPELESVTDDGGAVVVADPLSVVGGAVDVAESDELVEPPVGPIQMLLPKRPMPRMHPELVESAVVDSVVLDDEVTVPVADEGGTESEVTDAVVESEPELATEVTLTDVDVESEPELDTDVTLADVDVDVVEDPPIGGAQTVSPSRLIEKRSPHSWEEEEELDTDELVTVAVDGGEVTEAGALLVEPLAADEIVLVPVSVLSVDVTVTVIGSVLVSVPAEETAEDEPECDKVTVDVLGTQTRPTLMMSRRSSPTAHEVVTLSVTDG